MASSYFSRLACFERTSRARPTTERSAWNWANEDSRMPRARSAPTCASRFADML